jgi:UDP-3-O-[3-hydroxymyristoyl] glucosamine N-acyltransferase
MTRTAAELAQHLHAELQGDPNVRITSLGAPETAGPEDLIYLDGERNRARAEASRAMCVLVPPDLALAGKTVIRVSKPKLAFAQAAEWLLPRKRVPSGIHATAVVSPAARIASDAAIGPHVVVEEHASVASGASIDAFCFIGRGATISENTHLYPHVTLYEGVHLGRRVIVHSGAVIGADGFGYVFGEDRHWKFPQIGTVVIGDDVEIGANTTVDRGSLDTTHIADGVKIDNLVQVAHNVQIGENTVIASQTGISGSSSIGRRVMVGGQVGLGEHCTVEDGAVLGGQSGILNGKTIQAGQTVWGTPARPLERFKEQYAWFSRLPELGKRLRKLE